MKCTEVWWYWSMVITLHSINLTSGDQPKIIIVGAGPAGIAAASKLFENGFQNVTILEAENRIGGRVHTVQFGEEQVEMGAQWVHGQTNNIVFELAWPLGLLKVPGEILGSYFTIYNSRGDQIPMSISQVLFQLFFDIQDSLQEDAKSLNGSVGDHFLNMINAKLPQYPELNETLVKEFIVALEHYQTSEDGSDNWYEVSSRGYVESWTCPGSNAVTWENKGYETILDILMKKYPNPEEELPVLNNTLLNTEVVNINYDTTEGQVLIKTSTGQKYEAEHVITTPSLGVLKAQHETLFTPKLPDFKIETIKGLSMGSVSKLYLYYDTPWWPTDSEFGLVWNENDRKEYETDPDRKWLLDIFAFITIPNKPHVLSGWISGPGIRQVETLPETQVLNQTLALLNQFLGKTYNITEPTRFIRTNWYSNEHFRGTYSFRSMDTEKANVWADQLAAPLLDVNSKPIVMFAGEATHSHYYATVHGAIETGFREADRLIDLYKNKLGQ